MSMLFFDGFDGYDTGADLANFGGWGYSAGSVSSTVRIGAGKSLVLSLTDYRYMFSTNQAGNTLYIGLAYRVSSAHTGNRTIFSIIRADVNTQCTLCTTSGGLLKATRGDSNGTVLATGTNPIAINTWYYIEAKILVNTSTGIFDCKLNGTSEFSFSGNTANIGSTATEGFRLSSEASGLADDLYILNSQGSINNTYLGEVVINRLAQTGDSTVAFSRNTGATNYEAIDDLLGAPDDATTYVYATTTGTKDEYTLANTSTASTIYGVKVNTRAQKSDVNSKSFKSGIKTGTTDQQVSHPLGQGFANYVDIFETSDGSTTLWTPTTLDAAVSTIEVA